MLIQAKQINKPMISMVGLGTFTTSATSSDAVTTALTTALNTASSSGGSVPLAVGSNTAEGVSTTTGLNLVQLFVAGSTKQRLVDSNGNDVYGKITQATGIYTVSYFTSPSGVEGVYAFSSPTIVDMEIPYWFSFADLPSNAFIAVTERHVSPDLAGTTRVQSDTLTPTGVNVLPSLSRTATGVLFDLNINGVIIPAGASTGVSVSGTTVTINATNLGYNVTTTDVVAAFYSY